MHVLHEGGPGFSRSYLLVPRMAGGRAGRGHGGEDVWLAEGGEPHLALGIRVWPDGTPKSTLREQDQRGAEGLGVELVGKGDGGQVSAVADEAGVLRVKDCLNLGSTVLIQNVEQSKGKKVQ